MSPVRPALGTTPVNTGPSPAHAATTAETASVTRTSAHRRTSSRYHAAMVAARRAELLASARAIFAARGYHEATVEEITRAAGVAKGTFYLYFDEKREIFLAIIRDLLDRIKAIGASVSALAPGDHPLAFMARVEHAALGLMQLFLDNRDLARLAYRESMGMDAALETMLRDFYRETAEIEAHNIRVAQRVGLLRPCDPLLTAYAHIGMVERVLLTMLEEPQLFPEPRAVIREMMRLAYEGLRAEGAPSPFR